MKTLIIKRVNDDFDTFLCDNIQSCTSQVDVVDTFRIHGRLGRKIIKYVKNSGSTALLSIFLNITPQIIKYYNQIILFDDYPDLLLIEWIRKYNQHCIIKLWLWNVPNYPIEEYKRYCSIYCFDKEYCLQNDINFINQFYFDKFAAKYPTNNFTEGVVYVGIDKQRKDILQSMSNTFKQLGINYNIKLITFNSADLKLSVPGFEYLKKPLKYSDVIDLSVKSRAIIELVHKYQMGLTWRSLESMYFRKKMITNNTKIRNYDFYNKNNIFIYGLDNIEELTDFLESPYIELPNSILKKYSFDNWFELISK